jgi:uncharacterized repeat protein (TIGR04052 family)
MSFKKFLLRHVPIFVLSTVLFFLSACGGGGSDGGTATVSISGVAAVGTPLVNSRVVAKCASGTTVETTTNASGAYLLSVSPPPSFDNSCLLEVSSGTTNQQNNTDVLHSVIQTNTTAHVNPVTDMMVSYSLGRSASEAFADTNLNWSHLSTSIQQKKTDAINHINTQLTQLGLNAISGDVLAGDFRIGDANDQVLDQLKLFLSTKGLTLKDLFLSAGSGSMVKEKIEVEFDLVSSAAGVLSSVRCGDLISSLGSTATVAKLKDARFYVGNPMLLVRQPDLSYREVMITLETNQWNHASGAERVTLIDMENNTGSCHVGSPETNFKLVGYVPAAPDGTYVGIKFEVGVPFSLNHTNTVDMPAPLNNTAMAWSWASGRKFVKIELVDSGTNGSAWAASSGFSFHLGSTGCSGNPAIGQAVSCLRPNRMEFLANNFNVKTQKLAVNLTDFLVQNDITATGGTCMSSITDPDCVPLFSGLAIDMNNGVSLNHGSGQRFLWVSSK